MSDSWLSEPLKQKVKAIFEPRYGRNLTDEEVYQIADNLAGYFESILKFKFKTEYEKKQQQHP